MAYRRSHTIFRLLMPLIKESWLIEEVTSSLEWLCAIAHDLEKKSYHLSETKDIQAEGQMKNEDVQVKAHGSWLREEVTTFVQDWRYSSVRTNVKKRTIFKIEDIARDYLIKERKSFLKKRTIFIKGKIEIKVFYKVLG